VDDPYPIQTTEPVEGDPIVAGPIVGARQPDAELLAAHQPWLDRDADDVGVTGEPNRGEDTYVPQSRDDDTFAAHIVEAVTEMGCNMAVRSDSLDRLMFRESGTLRVMTMQSIWTS
jgi:hypothetical protein